MNRIAKDCSTYSESITTRAVMLKKRSNKVLEGLTIKHLLCSSVITVVRYRKRRTFPSNWQE